jgi:hypothetical protein
LFGKGDFIVGWRKIRPVIGPSLVIFYICGIQNGISPFIDPPVTKLHGGLPNGLPLAYHQTKQERCYGEECYCAWPRKALHGQFGVLGQGQADGPEKRLQVGEDGFHAEIYPKMGQKCK